MCWRTREHADKHSQDCMGVTLRISCFYRLRDEPRETILVACSTCEWTAAFSRHDLIASHGC